MKPGRPKKVNAALEESIVRQGANNRRLSVRATLIMGHATGHHFNDTLVMPHGLKHWRRKSRDRMVVVWDDQEVQS
jgi:hypothetical protein